MAKQPTEKKADMKKAETALTFQINPLKLLLSDFYAVTKRQVGLMDAQGKVILRYPEEMAPFCSMVQATKKGKERCDECDRTGCLMAQASGSLVSYPCHAGLREVCAPIRMEGETVGYLMFGHLPQEGDKEESWDKAKKGLADLAIDMDRAKAAYEELESESLSYIRSLSNILESCVCYIQLRHLVQHSGISVWNRAAGFIDAHLEEMVSLKTLAEVLSTSESTLERACREATGLTVGKYVQQKRMEMAIHLLKNTSLPIASVADKCGFENYNYFSRWFKETAGKSPREYRKEGAK